MIINLSLLAFIICKILFCNFVQNDFIRPQLLFYDIFKTEIFDNRYRPVQFLLRV